MLGKNEQVSIDNIAVSILKLSGGGKTNVYPIAKELCTINGFTDMIVLGFIMASINKQGSN